MVTSWPEGFPGFGQGAQAFAELVNQMSAGRLTVQVYGAGELVEALDVFNSVSSGAVEMGHSVSFYWQDKIPGSALFTSVPFGMTTQQTNAWLNFGGGLALWRKLYAPYGVIPFPGGSSDQQMGGWFNRPMEKLADFKQLKIRIPGLGGQVLARAGAIPVNIPGHKIFTALKTGAIDAAEWVGPYNDLALGLHQAGRYYYYPGWQEPGTTLEFLVGQKAFDALPSDLQAIVSSAAAVVNAQMLDEYIVRNAQAYQILTQSHGVEVRHFPLDLLAQLRQLTDELLDEQSEKDALTREIVESYRDFLAELSGYIDKGSYFYRDH
jgi:TRAP-type mannitol/chloroaromatic compound transport system substrate-binding protein